VNNILELEKGKNDEKKNKEHESSIKSAKGAF
jgi:hypothetical protein